jgi:hypothetical protein
VRKSAGALRNFRLRAVCVHAIFKRYLSENKSHFEFLRPWQLRNSCEAASRAAESCQEGRSMDANLETGQCQLKMAQSQALIRSERFEFHTYSRFGKWH